MSYLFLQITADEHQLQSQILYVTSNRNRLRPMMYDRAVEMFNQLYFGTRELTPDMNPLKVEDLVDTTSIQADPKFIANRPAFKNHHLSSIDSLIMTLTAYDITMEIKDSLSDKTRYKFEIKPIHTYYG